MYQPFSKTDGSYLNGGLLKSVKNEEFRKKITPKKVFYRWKLDGAEYDSEKSKALKKKISKCALPMETGCTGIWILGGAVQGRRENPQNTYHQWESEVEEYTVMDKSKWTAEKK